LNGREKILELTSVRASNRAGITVFRDLDFGLYAGDTAIIIGQTATGKTTLAELIVGTMKPERGSVKVFGKEIGMGNERQAIEIRRRIGGVGGIFDLIPNLTVSENILYPLILHGESKKERKIKLDQLLGQYNLTGRKKDKAFKLTRGEKVMALLARAVIADQPLLIIDEPLDRLDIATSENIIGLLKRLWAAGHALLILTNGRVGFEIPGSKEYQIKDGRLQ